MVLEIMGTNVSTIYIMSPPDPKQRLGIKLPFLILLIKNLHKYFTFEVKVRAIERALPEELRRDQLLIPASFPPSLSLVPLFLAHR